MAAGHKRSPKYHHYKPEKPRFGEDRPDTRQIFVSWIQWHGSQILIINGHHVPQEFRLVGRGIEKAICIIKVIVPENPVMENLVKKVPLIPIRAVRSGQIGRIAVFLKNREHSGPPELGFVHVFLPIDLEMDHLFNIAEKAPLVASLTAVRSG